MKPERIQRVAEDTRSFFATVLDWTEAVVGAFKRLLGIETHDND